MNNAITELANQNLFQPGVLEVKFIPFKEKEGGFKVGSLTLPFCTVEIKDNWIESFDLGEYRGAFLVTKMSIKAIPTRHGGMFSVFQADVPQYQIEDQCLTDSSDNTFEDDTPERIDPAVEEQWKKPQQESRPEKQFVQRQAAPKEPKQAPVQADKPVSTNTTHAESVSGSNLSNAQIELLQKVVGVSSLEELPDEFKPDVSVPRTELREFFALVSVDNGGTHKFEPATQSWKRAS